MAQRRGAHRQLFRRQARAGAIDRVKDRQQVEVNPAQDWMHNIHHLLISLHLILFTIPLMLWVSNVAFLDTIQTGRPMSITIRQATPDDATAIYDMIYELAVYEKAPKRW
jgi:hypothetical protein